MELTDILATILKEHMEDFTLQEWWKNCEVTPQNLQIEVRRLTGEIPSVEEITLALLKIPGVIIQFGYNAE